LTVLILIIVFLRIPVQAIKSNKQQKKKEKSCLQYHIPVSSHCRVWYSPSGIRTQNSWSASCTTLTGGRTASNAHSCWELGTSRSQKPLFLQTFWPIFPVSHLEFQNY